MKKVIRLVLLGISSILTLSSCSFLDGLIPTGDGGNTASTSGTDSTPTEFAFRLLTPRLNTGEELRYEYDYGPYSSLSFNFSTQSAYFETERQDGGFYKYFAKSKEGYADFGVRVKDASNNEVVFEKTYKIAMNLVAVESVKFKNSELALKTNNTYNLEYEILPADASFSDLKIIVSDEAKLSYSTGKLTTLADGDSTVTIQVEDGEASFSDVCSVNSVYQPLEGIEFLSSSVEISQGYETPAQIRFIPEDASNKDFTLTSNSSDVTIKGGKLLGNVIGGSATVTITASGFTATCAVSVIGIAKSDRVDMAETYYNVDTSPSNYCSTPSVGTSKLLVIPVWFTDSGTYITSDTNKDNVLDDISECYVGDTKSNGWRSVHSYYHDESNGLCDLDVTIAPWYNDSHDSSYYYTDDLKVLELASESSDYYFEHSAELREDHVAVSKEDYDNNSDGSLDGVLLIYAAPDRQASAQPDHSNMWAYCAHRASPRNIANPTINVYFWASYDFMYNSAVANSRAGTSYHNGSIDSAGYLDSTTFIHEMGHMFGLTDYYDYARVSDPAGSYTMQDHDAGGHDPFSLLALGWAKAYIPENSCTITLDDVYAEHEVIILTPSWNAYNSPFDEYLVLELYSPTGLNLHDQDEIKVPNIGIRLWHVDARLYSTKDGSITNTTTVNNGYFFQELCSNDTYNGSNGGKFPLGSDYYEYNLLQLIRKSGCDTHMPTRGESEFKPNSLFYAGDSFSMSDYQNQFKNKTKLNSGVDLGWSFHVDGIDEGNLKALITFTKA